MSLPSYIFICLVLLLSSEVMVQSPTGSLSVVRLGHTFCILFYATATCVESCISCSKGFVQMWCLSNVSSLSNFFHQDISMFWLLFDIFYVINSYFLRYSDPLLWYFLPISFKFFSFLGGAFWLLLLALFPFHFISTCLICMISDTLPNFRFLSICSCFPFLCSAENYHVNLITVPLQNISRILWVLYNPTSTLGNP